MSSSTYKPLCPCCFQAYSNAVVAGEIKIAEGGSDGTANPTNRMIFCGTCAPSDVEKALAQKASSGDTTVPPIVWLLTPKEIEESAEKILSDTEANLDAIASVPLEQVTFENTIAKLMTPPNYKTNPQVAACKFLQHCSTDAAVREAASAAGKKFAASRVQGRMRKDVYQRVKAFSENAAAVDQLTDYQKHFVKAAKEDFERAGLALPEEDAQKLRELLEQDAAVCSQYSKNLGSDDTKLLLDPEELKGCGEDFIKERLSKDQEGKCTITLKYPDIIPIGQICEVPETRRKVTEAREGIGAYKNNLDLVAQGVQLRKQIATILGYPSWAEYICSKRMSGSCQAVNEFLTNLQDKLTESGKEDRDVLLELKADHCKEIGVEFDGKLNAWDTSFYSNRLLKTKYGVDAEAIRQYFPLDHVVETTLSIYQELLGLTFRELAKGTYWSWHVQVRCFEVSDTETKQRLGHFYLDLHPRTGKYGHAAIFHLVKHSVNQGAVDCMLCNLPASTPEKPSLLLHSNVVTFFHEFGHIMHGLCSEGIGNSTRLAKCPRDFVEAPSQMLENWCWQKSILERLSKHYETGESLPDEMLQSMIKAKHVGVAFGSLRQIYLSTLDLTIHGLNPPKDAAGLQAIVDELRPKITLVDNPEGNNMLRTFGHLMNQYSASYYGYMWAEVLSADMFATRFEMEGVMNPRVGMEYRKMVLAPGGTHNITDHLTKFLGRPPSNEAFLKSRGILND
ncbi:Zn-dependent oligopeptidase [Nitzschia inconspicua]|uniref:Zn-dependent oligopeptidase n=1 Tax=Nitzschia inconspicua TaxID=303405 RepID=A0A9K3Q1X0_9STRA|nr:Zn-dependent oligopeptidase [Nitzschia inconspicua]